MSHRKYSRPRHGNLGFLPRKRCRRGQARIKAFRKDDSSQQPHLTAFFGYKAGMTHVLRDAKKLAQKVVDIEVVDPVTIIECPPMVVMGVKGYRNSTFGSKALTAVFAPQIDESAKRRMAYKNWNHPLGRTAFRQHEGLYENEEYKKNRDEKIKFLKERADTIRIIAHTQPNVLGIQKKAHIMEIQVNGGDSAQKVDYALKLLGQKIRFPDYFKDFEMVDLISITKGKGKKGVVSRWGVTRLPRKTHKGLRKVACIGAWHPSRVAYSVARVGQKGYHHRVDYNKKLYMVGHALDDSDHESKGRLAGRTDQDLTDKGINPVGGFPGYGDVKHDFVIVRGSCPGPRKRGVAIRKTVYEQKNKRAEEEIKIKFIDTASKIGHGKFQTLTEKRNFMGKMKRDVIREQNELLAAAREKRKREETA